MMCTILAREWREIRGTVSYSLAALVFFGFLVPEFDQVAGLAAFSGIVAILLGNRSPATDRSGRVREFLFTLPVRRRRLVAAKLALSLLALNALTGLLSLVILLNVPVHFYHLFAPTFFERQGNAITFDAPIYYPLVFTGSSALLLIVAALESFLQRSIWAAIGGSLLLMLGAIGTVVLLHRWPHSFGSCAVGSAVVCTVLAASVYLFIIHRFSRLELAGGRER